MKSTVAILVTAMFVGDRTTASPSLAGAAAVAVVTGSDLHPVQRVSAARRRRVPGSREADRRCVDRTARHRDERRGLVRVLRRLPRRY